jgi:iron complex transport system substrate-binding protein
VTSRALVLAAAVLLACHSAQSSEASEIGSVAGARRIVTLSPHLAEIVYAAGAGSRLVGVVRDSDYPPPVRWIPQVGDAARVDAEKLIALGPDLVLGWRSGNPPAEVSRLQRLGLRVLVTETRRLDEIPALVRTIGAVAGTRAAAERSARAFDDELAALRERYGHGRRVRVFYQIWHDPLLTVNRTHLISDVVELCGGENVFADAAALTPAVSVEAVLARRPEIVLGGSSTGTPEALASYWRSSPLRALRALPVGYVPPDLIQRQTPRVLEGARIVCGYLETLRNSGAVAGR